MKRQRIIAYAFLAIAGAAYLYALALPAIVYHPFADPNFRPGGVPAVEYGWEVLEEGWAGIFLGSFAWYANVVALVAAILAAAGTRPGSAAVLAMTAFALGLDSLAFDMKMLDESGGHNLYVDHLGRGYYVWEVAFLILALPQLVTFLLRRRTAA